MLTFFCCIGGVAPAFSLVVRHNRDWTHDDHLTGPIRPLRLAADIKGTVYRSENILFFVCDKNEEVVSYIAGNKHTWTNIFNSALKVSKKKNDKRCCIWWSASNSKRNERPRNVHEGWLILLNIKKRRRSISYNCILYTFGGIPSPRKVIFNFKLILRKPSNRWCLRPYTCRRNDHEDGKFLF